MDGSVGGVQPECEGTQYLEEAAAKIEEFEGRVQWMYLDSKGYVTVGVGRMLPDLLAAQALPFQLGERPATMGEVEEDFERVSKLAPNHLPTFYVAAKSVKLLNPDIDVLLFSIVCDVDRALRKMFWHYTFWPKSARLGAIDMHYNLGAERFAEYKHMIAALDNEDFETAAKECDRNKEDAAFAARNYWTRMCFMDAQLMSSTPVNGQQKAS